MRKKILTMSIAAILTAMTSSGVMAFDTSGSNQGIDKEKAKDGPILFQGGSATDYAAYQGNLLPLVDPKVSSTVNLHPPVPSIGTLKLSANGRGDALIFPLFTQTEGWGSEVVVRNTDQEHAIVAKVALYAKDDSREILDFNLYLSASDVVRFKIENGNLISTDGSILRYFPSPSSNVDDVDESDFASVDKPFSRALPEGVDSGYIIVYGMAQALGGIDAQGGPHDKRYHKEHARLFENYRRELDVCRPDWRIGHLNAMKEGTYIRHTTNSANTENYSVATPNQAINCNFATRSYSSTIKTVFDNTKNIEENANIVKDEADKVDNERVKTQTEVDTVANAAVDVVMNTTADYVAAVDVANNAVTNANDFINIITSIIANPNIIGGSAILRAAQDARDDVITARNDVVTASNDVVTARNNAANATATTSNTALENAIKYAKEATNNAVTAANKSISAAEALAKVGEAVTDAVVAAIAAEAASQTSSFTPGNFFGDVDPSLTGTVRLYSAVDGARDMILTAKAIKNFTAGNKIIYTEGEIGALQDRTIKGSWDDDNDSSTPEVNKKWAVYDEKAIRYDAEAFLVTNTTYTFAANSVANQLIITQPYKRVLVQLGNDDGYWQNVNGSNKFGSFSFIYNVFNEHEEMDNIPYTDSPHKSGITTYGNEVESLADLEDKTEFEGENGYALLRFTNVGGQNAKIPAIITQMIGTTVGANLEKQINWIYSQFEE